MSRPRKLPLSVEPFVGESFYGYLCRATAANDFPTVQSLSTQLQIHSYGFSTTLELAREQVESLSEILGVGQERILSMLPVASDDDKCDISINGLEIRDSHYLKMNRRVSAGGLRLSCFHRHVWQLRDVGFCPESFELLFDICPNPECRNQLTWKAFRGVEICESCGIDLRDVEGQMIVEEDRHNLSFLADLISTDAAAAQRARLQLPSALRMLSPGVILQLAGFLGRIDVEGAYPQRVANVRRIKTEYPNVQARGAQIVLGYPGTVAAMIEDSPDEISPKLFLRIQNIMRSSVTKPACQFLKQMISDLRPTAQSSLKGLKLLRQGQNMLTVRDVASRLGVDNAAVTRLTDAGLLTGKSLRGESRKIRWYDPEIVDEVAKSTGDRIETDALVGRFGLTRTAVDQLLQAGLLRHHPSEVVATIYRGTYLVRSEVEAFMFKLRATLQTVHEDPNDWLKLRDFFASLGPGPRPWSVILDLALTDYLPGGLAISDAGGPISQDNIYVSYELLRAISSNKLPLERPPESTRHDCTLLEVEERMSCFPRDVALLIENGFLSRVLPDSPKVKRSSLIAASNDLITSSEVAARLGLNKNSLLSWAQKRGLQPVSKNLRIWKRDDVERYLPNLF